LKFNCSCHYWSILNVVLKDVPKIGEATVSHGSHIGSIKASRWQTRQGTIGIKGTEGSCSQGYDLTRVEASGRKAREGTSIVEIIKEVISHISPTGPKVR
jgi:hypothetical protein